MLGGVDILVNAAAMPGGVVATPEARGSDHRRALGRSEHEGDGLPAVRTRGRAADGEHGWGRIINVSGLAARQSGSTIGSIRNVAVAAHDEEPRRRARAARHQRAPSCTPAPPARSARATQSLRVHGGQHHRPNRRSRRGRLRGRVPRVTEERRRSPATRSPAAAVPAARSTTSFQCEPNVCRGLRERTKRSGDEIHCAIFLAQRNSRASE